MLEVLNNICTFANGTRCYILKVPITYQALYKKYLIYIILFNIKAAIPVLEIRKLRLRKIK